MQDADLLVQLAGIAGVFVGFGALISVRSGGPSEAHEVTYIRSVVSVAIWVVVVALAPVIVNRYGVTGHELWLACSLVALVLLLGVWFVNEHTPETRELGAAWSRAQTIRSVASYLGLMIPTIAALILVVFGPSSSRARSLGSEHRRDEEHPHGDDDPLPLLQGPGCGSCELPARGREPSRVCVRLRLLLDTRSPQASALPRWPTPPED